MAVDRILMIVSDTVRTDMLDTTAAGSGLPISTGLPPNRWFSIATTRRVFQRFLRATTISPENPLLPVSAGARCRARIARLQPR